MSRDNHWENTVMVETISQQQVMILAPMGTRTSEANELCETSELSGANELIETSTP